MSTTLVVDGANVVGARPDVVVLVLEGAAKGGVRAGRDGHVRVVHAKGNGDDTIVAETAAAAGRGERVSVVTADRFLQSRVQGAGAIVLGPSWLWDQLD